MTRLGTRLDYYDGEMKSLEERLALAAVGRDGLDELAAADQVHDVEALAQLARLGVAEPDAVADPQLRGRAEQRRLDLAGALARVELEAGGRNGRGSRSRPAAPEAG